MLVQLVHKLHNQIFVNEKYFVVFLEQVVKGSIHSKLLVEYESSLQHAISHVPRQKLFIWFSLAVVELLIEDV